MSPRPRRGEPRRLAGSLSRVLDELGHGAAAKGAAVMQHWEEVVGAEAARHCEPVVLRGRVLEVAADSPAWSQQLQLRREEILVALQGILGSDAPADLRLRVR